MQGRDFLNPICNQSLDAYELQGNSLRIVEHLTTHPNAPTEHIAQALDLTYWCARSNLYRLADRGIITKYKDDKRNVTWSTP